MVYGVCESSHPSFSSSKRFKILSCFIKFLIPQSNADYALDGTQQFKNTLLPPGFSSSSYLEF